jgi:hypothetical protein
MMVRESREPAVCDGFETVHICSTLALKGEMHGRLPLYWPQNASSAAWSPTPSLRHAPKMVLCARR